ncbi:MAG: DUF6468 domain-containing protein [Alphaproteobacteria bacterium]|nr:DUF6468 domain-containing protein [Alphaproteobacteria bacterium]
MTGWIGLFLDTALIGVVGAGVVQATRLIRQLSDLRASRAEMERFVRDFNGAVVRAEDCIKNLRRTARESGDDLEKLVEKAGMVRDELNFIVESADGIADRLSSATSKAMRSEPPSAGKQEAPRPPPPVEQRKPRKPATVSPIVPPQSQKAPISRAEQELIQALKKLG